MLTAYSFSFRTRKNVYREFYDWMEKTKFLIYKKKCNLEVSFFFGNFAIPFSCETSKVTAFPKIVLNCRENALTDEKKATDWSTFSTHAHFFSSAQPLFVMSFNYFKLNLWYAGSLHRWIKNCSTTAKNCAVALWVHLSALSSRNRSPVWVFSISKKLIQRFYWCACFDRWTLEIVLLLIKLSQLLMRLLQLNVKRAINTSYKKVIFGPCFLLSEEMEELVISPYVWSFFCELNLTSPRARWENMVIVHICAALVYV